MTDRAAATARPVASHGPAGSPRPPRILALTWEYPPVVEGGLARHVQGLSRAQVRAGTDVVVLTRSGARSSGEAVPTDEHDEDEGVRLVRVPEPGPPSDLDAFLAWVAELNDGLAAAGRRVLAEGPVDVVHGHDWLVAAAAATLAAEAGVPYVATMHATEHGRHEGRVHQHPQSVIHAHERRMVRDADLAVVCSRFMARHVASALGADAARTAVVRNGVEPLAPPVEADGPRRARAEAGEPPVVLMAGRLVYEKGFQVALDALADVADRPGAPPFRVVVAGDGPHAGALRDQAAGLGLADRTSFLGWVADDALAPLYASADVCLVPSLYEPFGLVALEAMRGGCATVVARTGGLAEVVPEGVGLRVTPGAPTVLADALAPLLADPVARGRLGRAGLAHAATFGWDRAATEIAHAYRAVLAAPLRGGRLH